MSITTELARFVPDRDGTTCGSCAAGLVFLPDSTGRYETHPCPCTHDLPIEHVAEIDAPTPDPMNTDHKEQTR